MASLPPDRLKDVPLHEIGDQILELIPMLTRNEVARPIVFIAVGDADTGELISTANLDGQDLLNLLQLLTKSHEEGAYREEAAAPPADDTPEEETKH